jgi:hypothetical protein
MYWKAVGEPLGHVTVGEVEGRVMDALVILKLSDNEFAAAPGVATPEPVKGLLAP